MKHFCVLPWLSKEINLENNQNISCCWMKRNYDVEEVKNDLLNDNRSLACEKCWSLEDKNIESRRQMENKFVDFVLDKDLEIIKQQILIEKSNPILYQFYVGSLCNSTCTTCGPMFSSSWKSLLGSNKSIKIENNIIEQNFNQIANTINWEAIKKINILGGEPLLIKQSMQILEYLLKWNNTDCLVSFVTNGSTLPTSDQINLFKKFKNISACVSIDGLDRTFEYIRYPLKWKTIVSNIDIYKTIFKEVTASFTISNLNFHEKDKIINWFNEQHVRYIENYVTHPQYFNIHVQPGHPLWQQFVKEINRQDLLKNISIKDYIPHIATLIFKE
jgi:MoaA/NifB/PqqE/SkfB family radical SAM enzyme